LVSAAKAGDLPETVRFAPAPPLPAEAEMEGMKDVTWLKSWACFAPDFAGENLQRYAKLQTWSIRPAVDKS
jgi:hypothetical protein